MQLRYSYRGDVSREVYLRSCAGEQFLQKPGCREKPMEKPFVRPLGLPVALLSRSCWEYSSGAQLDWVCVWDY